MELETIIVFLIILDQEINAFISHLLTHIVVNTCIDQHRHVFLSCDYVLF